MRTIAMLTAALVVGLSSSGASAASRSERINCSPSSRVITTGRTYNSTALFNFTQQCSNSYAMQVQAQANFIQARADYQLKAAQAAVANQQARALAMQNRELQIAQQAELQAAWKEREAEKLARNKISPERLAQIARERAPQQLTASDINVATGEIEWPELLQKSEFANDRKQIEQMVKAGASSQAIREASQVFSAKLRDRVTSKATNDYIAASKFLNQLRVTDFSVQPAVLVAGK